MLLVGEEQVPQPLSPRSLAQLYQQLRVGHTRAHLLIEGRDGLRFHREHVLLGETTDALAQF